MYEYNPVLFRGFDFDPVTVNVFNSEAATQNQMVDGVNKFICHSVFRSVLAPPSRSSRRRMKTTVSSQHHVIVGLGLRGEGAGTLGHQLHCGVIRVHVCKRNDVTVIKFSFALNTIGTIDTIGSNGIDIEASRH